MDKDRCQRFCCDYGTVGWVAMATRTLIRIRSELAIVNLHCDDEYPGTKGTDDAC